MANIFDRYILENVPSDELRQIVGDFRDEGAKVSVEPQTDGNLWTVIALKPAKEEQTRQLKPLQLFETS